MIYNLWFITLISIYNINFTSWGLLLLLPCTYAPLGILCACSNCIYCNLQICQFGICDRGLIYLGSDRISVLANHIPCIAPYALHTQRPSHWFSLRVSHFPCLRATPNSQCNPSGLSSYLQQTPFCLTLEIFVRISVYHRVCATYA
jgi:hypothetical protein